MYFPLVVVVLCLSLFFMHNFLSIAFCNHLEEEERAGCFAIMVLQMYCNHICYEVPPHGAMGSSAVRDCGIS